MYWRSRNSNTIGRMFLDKALIQNVYYVKPAVREHTAYYHRKGKMDAKANCNHWSPRLCVCRFNEFFGVSLLNCSFRSESRVTHASRTLWCVVFVFMASLQWNLVHSTHYGWKFNQNNGNNNWHFLYMEVVWHYDLTSDRIMKPALHSWDDRASG